MVFIFWQGIVSIHQKSFLEALSKQPSVSKVLLVVEKDITPYRKNMGWDVPKIAITDIIISPSTQQIHDIITRHPNAVHIMGGVRSGRMISTAFNACTRQKCRIGIMTEPYDETGLKGWLRSLKYRYYQARYFQQLQFILAIGKGEGQFARLGYDQDKLFPWAYFISLDNAKITEKKSGNKIRIIYAGRLEEEKGIYRFMDELMMTGAKNYEIDIYGIGPHEKKIKRLVAEKGVTDSVGFYHFLKHDELITKYSNYNWVVLPSSSKDGWGAIVSEGLLNGLKAICSDMCGASGVIKDGFNGIVFDWAEEGSCKKAIEAMLKDDHFADARTIRSWANDTISGVAGAAYFIKIMDCVYEHKAKPGIPWE